VMGARTYNIITHRERERERERENYEKYELIIIRIRRERSSIAYNLDPRRRRVDTLCPTRN